MPCRFEEIIEYLRPQPTNLRIPRSSTIPSGTVVSRYYKGGGRVEAIVLIAARVEGIGPVLQILEEGQSVCHFVFGLHKLLWQHWMLVAARCVVVHWRIPCQFGEIVEYLCPQPVVNC
jgi:hypothetical protein